MWLMDFEEKYSQFKLINVIMKTVPFKEVGLDCFLSHSQNKKFDRPLECNMMDFTDYEVCSSIFVSQNAKNAS